MALWPKTNFLCIDKAPTQERKAFCASSKAEKRMQALFRAAIQQWIRTPHFYAAKESRKDWQQDLQAVTQLTTWQRMYQMPRSSRYSRMMIPNRAVSNISGGKLEKAMWCFFPVLSSLHLSECKGGRCKVRHLPDVLRNGNLSLKPMAQPLSPSPPVKCSTLPEPPVKGFLQAW